MKKRVSLLILLAMLVTIIAGTASPLPAFAATETNQYGDLTYTVSNGEITITKCNSAAVGTIEIPNTIDGMPVTTISNAFNHCSKITGITIPENCITRIRYDFCTGCPSLKSITVDSNNTAFCSIDGILYSKDKTELIVAPNKATGTRFTVPGSVATIGRYAFADSTELESIILTNVISAEDNSFSNCAKLKEVTTGDKLQRIGGSAFHSCSSLEEINLPKALESIGQVAFCNCTNLKSMIIPVGCTMTDNPFVGCTSLENIAVDSNNSFYHSENGIVYSKDKSKIIIAPNKATGESFVVPDSVTTIGANAFASDKDLESISLSNVNKIENDAFSYCHSLKTFTGNKLRLIESDAFLDTVI